MYSFGPLGGKSLLNKVISETSTLWGGRSTEVLISPQYLFNRFLVNFHFPCSMCFKSLFFVRFP